MSTAASPHLIAKDGGLVRLRPANMKDSDILFDWQCHPDTRRHFRNPEPPTTQEHAEWMQARTAEQMIWMLTLDGDCVGMVRLDEKPDGAAEVSILVDPARHGLGLGKAALALLRHAHPEKTLHAEVLADNAASRALFLAAGYENDGDIYICTPRCGIVVFRADAGPGIGGGHVMRCLALAGELSRDGWTVAFACSSDTPATVPVLVDAAYPMITVGLANGSETMAAAWPDGVDWLVVDHYGLDAKFETACRGWARKILVIDDLADRPHDGDVLLDQTPGRTPEDYGLGENKNCRPLLGTNYAILRPEFATMRPKALQRRGDVKVRRLIIFCGTVDRANLTAKALQALDGIDLDAVDVVLGSMAPHLEQVNALAATAPCPVTVHTDLQDMAGLLADADIAVGAAGTSSWERCCLGLPTVVVIIADNQQRIADGLQEAGAATVLGWHEDVTPAKINESIATVCNDATLRQNMSTAAAALCDGLGANRVVNEMI
ncbi:MAG: UDP-2,4-diacetamido-2,4,6-trideoxy-beta-L-altropyranose hydrolase [Rhodospirillaceae bacterium]|jgi:UDP-2,4-diacetamido-2,4,6-trideoxy-beta-L-altropyranose hydrolase|nr:UDP-2,4-diacetamido-2,4,6-trideoxy-beta-L-altropyranose hydrolase [Rhodospirillaceae bacterium]MBT4219291.1 UDP-2,4-diacetamido-2,4,6-trideoxy-beta-L-altropyranose hydrolase [Rhodospirillaceae bacterium]MBT4464959.1 UDP-2,4-diacetamido-2,4,6-trideoxy-beta-L-altropyranose hydrolase [Rhodospirillaceae bacterium]MBT5013150.1 UDP-2,4-diacetamido-2,4,6-trideoxy-beta-L-altropyranose hydrolase [Rhodospirillaceae bacterium]MBT6406262.1 UDP-2,4-diacetamido-2,4,6-trideoxy-beta-L-altropyranose hydrolas